MPTKSVSRHHPIVISVGGSIIFPRTGIDVKFLRHFRAFILHRIKRGDRFIVVVGGGTVCRDYQQAVRAVFKPTDEDMDWLGIHSTRFNGQLLRNILRDVAQHVVVKNPTRKIAWKRPVLIAAGWKPGHSTDAVAVQLAKTYDAQTIINLSNIDRVYDKDPFLHEDAVPQSRMDWPSFRKLVGNRWSPGANAPFDPVAARMAHRWNMTVVVMGKNLENVEKYLSGKKFKGTVIG